MKHQIKSVDGRVLFECDLHDGATTAQVVSAAVAARANLEGANLEGANLEGANLEGAVLENNAKLIGGRPIIQVGPIGSRSSYLAAYITDVGVMLRAGCFFGSVGEFRQASAKTHGESVHAQEYEAALAFIKKHAKLWGQSDARS